MAPPHEVVGADPVRRLGATLHIAGSGSVGSESSPAHSPPPTDARLPPDGHEFPPSFLDLQPDTPLIQPPSGFSDSSAGEGREDSGEEQEVDRRPPARYQRSESVGGRGMDMLSSRRSRAGEKESRSTLDLQKEVSAARADRLAKSSRGQISVKDKIAMFSSQSVEQLTSSHPKLQKFKSLENDLEVGNKAGISSHAIVKQCPQKFHNKTEEETQTKTSQSYRSNFGSLLNMHINEGNEEAFTNNQRHDAAGRKYVDHRRASIEGRPTVTRNSLTKEIIAERNTGSDKSIVGETKLSFEKRVSSERKMSASRNISDMSSYVERRSGTERKIPTQNKVERKLSDERPRLCHDGRNSSVNSSSNTLVVDALEVSSQTSGSSGSRDVSPSPISERSQSLFDLVQPEKRHSFAALHEREYSYGSHAGDLSRKVSLNSISEERRRSISRLRGLVIPDKVDGFLKRSPVDLPTIKSKQLSSLSSSSFRVVGGPSSSSTPKKHAAMKSQTMDPRQLASPPWKGESPNLPKYSPAFKRKNISVHAPGGQPGSAFRLVSSSSKLGGSSVELSRPCSNSLAPDVRSDPRPGDRRSEPPTSRRHLETREPLQRSSSLNSRPLSAGGQLRRKISDDDVADLASRLEAAENDVGGSTVTLVDEASSQDQKVRAERSRSGSMELDYRASTSTLHDSPIKELDVAEELKYDARSCTRDDSGALRPDKELKRTAGSSQESTVLDVSDAENLSDKSKSVMSDQSLGSSATPARKLTPDFTQLSRLAVRRSSITPHTPGAEEKSPSTASGSPPRILEDSAWRTFASGNDRRGASNRSTSIQSGVEGRDLAKLRQVTKASMQTLKQKWQQLSTEGTTPTNPARPSRPDRATSNDPAPASSTDQPDAALPRRSPCDLSADLSVAHSPDVARGESDRKLSTPTLGSDAAATQREPERGWSSPRPQSWMEGDRPEVTVFELGGHLTGGASIASTASSQESILDSLDGVKSPCGSTSSLLEMLTANLKQSSRSTHVLSVSDLRRAFERFPPHGAVSGHTRMSSLDSSASEELPPGLASASGSTASPTSTREHYGSITSLASSTSLISPHELQQLIEDANQSLEEAGTPSHEIIVAVIHREMLGGSIGVTLAGGADYENKEISVNKVIAGSVADRDGRIKRGDRVISINGRSARGMTHREALNTLKAPRAEVVLVLSRARSVTPHDPGTDDVIYQRPSLSKTSSRPPKILESPLDSTNLASELAAEDNSRGPPAVITLKKEGAGLGFSLQGGKDSPLGDRPLVAKKIFAGGAADKSGKLHVNDQILAINEHDIQHMARIEAWTLLKKQPDGLVRLTIRKWLPNLPPGGDSQQAEDGTGDATTPATCVPSSAMLTPCGTDKKDENVGDATSTSETDARTNKAQNAMPDANVRSIHPAPVINAKASSAAVTPPIRTGLTAVSSTDSDLSVGSVSAHGNSFADVGDALPPVSTSRPVITGVTPKSRLVSSATSLPKTELCL